MPGPIALVGSGEYLPSMLEVERALLAGRPPRYVQLPTAAGREGQARLDYWVRLGREQAGRLGVEAVPLPVTDRASADDPDLAARVAGAGLIYLSGGDPGYLADTLRDTAVWRAIVAAWEGGAALAGCSAGAMAMAVKVPDIRRWGSGGRAGLGLLPAIRVLPHFDRMLGRVPDLLMRPLVGGADGVSVVGIDEETALVAADTSVAASGGPTEFVVAGRQSVWLLGNGRREELAPGARVTLPAGRGPR